MAGFRASFDFDRTRGPRSRRRPDADAQRGPLRFFFSSFPSQRYSRRDRYSPRDDLSRRSFDARKREYDQWKSKLCRLFCDRIHGARIFKIPKITELVQLERSYDSPSSVLLEKRNFQTRVNFNPVNCNCDSPGRNPFRVVLLRSLVFREKIKFRCFLRWRRWRNPSTDGILTSFTSDY